MRRGTSIAGRLFLGALALFLVLCTTNEIRQRIAVRRAAALLSDMHSVRLHQSDWSDAQRLMTRWGRWGHYDGTCSSQHCFYTITLTGPVAGQTGTGAFLSAFRLLPRQWAGGFMMDSMILVQDGRIVRSGLQIEMMQSPFAKTPQRVTLVISVLSRSSLGISDAWYEKQRSRHPDYVTWRPGGCSTCLMGRVFYADNMAPEEAAKLSDFQLSCATRWSSCVTLEELDPAAHAWHLYHAPWGDPPEPATPQPMPAGCLLPLYSLGRDANRIVLVEALADSKRGDPTKIEGESSHAKVLATLKGDSPWAIGSIQEIASKASYFEDDINRRPPVHFVKGQRYMLMLGAGSVPQNFSSFETCGIIKDDPASESEVRRGMAMDDPLPGPEPSGSLSGLF